MGSTACALEVNGYVFAYIVGGTVITVVLGIGTCARAILQRDTPSRSDSDDAIVFHFGAGTPYASRSGVGYVV